MMIKEIIGKILAGERDGTTLWKIAINEIDYPPITDPAEGVLVASLAENILHCGQLQPILLYRLKDATFQKQTYRLIAGRRRIEAMRMLGHTHINAIVVRCEPGRADVLSLSENMLHREPNIWEVAERMKSLINAGMDMNRLAALLAISVDQMKGLLDLPELPKDEARLMKLAHATPQDIDRLLKLPRLARLEILEKACELQDGNLSDWIDQWDREPDLRLSPIQKICVGDVRLFLNTLERSVETMQSAGFDVRLIRKDDIDSHTFTIQVAKRAGMALQMPAVDNVSRETMPKGAGKPRFSTALSIFEAIAEDECTFAGDVSRETFGERAIFSEENTENDELCIDCLSKKCYNN